MCCCYACRGWKGIQSKVFEMLWIPLASRAFSAYPWSFCVRHGLSCRLTRSWELTHHCTPGTSITTAGRERERERESHLVHTQIFVHKHRERRDINHIQQKNSIPKIQIAPIIKTPKWEVPMYVYATHPKPNTHYTTNSSSGIEYIM